MDTHDMKMEDMVQELIRIQADPDHWSLSLDGFRRVCRYFMKKARFLEAILAGNWQLGKPTSPGLWVVQYQNQDYDIAVVTEDLDDEEGTSYLRVNIRDDSCPLDHPESELSRFAKRSYGPIPIEERI